MSEIRKAKRDIGRYWQYVQDVKELNKLFAQANVILKRIKRYEKEGSGSS